MSIKNPSARRLLTGVLVLLVGLSLANVAVAEPRTESGAWWVSTWSWLVEHMDGILKLDQRHTETSLRDKAGPHGDPDGGPEVVTERNVDPLGDRQ